MSLSCIASKVIKSFSKDHMTQHMNANNPISKKHFGFLRGRSTVLQLLGVLDEWTDSLARGIHIDAVYIDFPKAFDKVPHKRLISIIISYGVMEEIGDWVDAFLSDRIQKVCINGKSSHRPRSPVAYAKEA